MRKVGEETGIPIDIYDRYDSMTRPVARMKEKMESEL